MTSIRRVRHVADISISTVVIGCSLSAVTANTVIGVNNYYASKEACETNGPIAKWEYVMGGRCD